MVEKNMKHIDIDEIPCQNRQGYGSLRQFFAGSAESEDETRFPRSVPVTLHFRERDRFSCDLHFAGTNPVEGVSTRLSQLVDHCLFISLASQGMKRAE